MSPEFIEQMIGVLQGTSILEFEYEEQGSCVRLRLDRDTDQVGAHEAVAGQEALLSIPVSSKKRIVATGIGVLRLTHPQHDKPFILPGSLVQEGQVVAFLQAGALLREITSSVSGVLRECLVEDGDLIGYGQAVFEVE